MGRVLVVPVCAGKCVCGFCSEKYAPGA